MSNLDDAKKNARARDAARRGEEAPPSSNGGALTRQGGEELAIEIDGDQFLASPKDMADKVKSGAWEAAPQLFELEEGKTYHFHLDGEGPPAELPDIRTRELKLVPTWILSSVAGTGVRVSILSTAQLDRKLPPFIGGEVMITKLGSRDTNSGGRVTEYVVAGPKRSDGKARDWSGKRPEHVEAKSNGHG